MHESPKPGQIVLGSNFRYGRRGCGASPITCNLFLKGECLMGEKHDPASFIKTDGTILHETPPWIILCEFDSPPVEIVSS